MANSVLEESPELRVEAPEACYIFTPSNHSLQGIHAAKKRKVSGKRSNDDVEKTSAHQELPRLLDSREPSYLAEARLAAFHQAWSEKETRLEDAIDAANAGVILQISNFILDAVIDSSSRQIPAGLINAGLASSTSGSMFEAVAQNVRGRHRSTILRINASECHNLKAALKTIIHRGTAEVDAGYEENDYMDLTEGRQLLNYDLQALYHHIQARGTERCVVFFQNSEALDPQVLAELVDVLVSWRDRLPFILLFEMAISGDLFQEKLARTTVRQLRGAMFESKTSRDMLDILFSAATCDKDSALFIGPSVSKMLLDQQTDRIASVKSFISALKYCYMMHFFNNPLSFLCLETRKNDLHKEHAEYLQSLPSFSRHMDVITGDGKSGEARKLMNDKAYLIKEVRSMLKQSRHTIRDIQAALEVLLLLNDYTSLRPHLTHSSLYIKALAGELADSQIVRELLLSVRKLPSNRMLGLLEELRGVSILRATDLDPNINWLRSTAKNTEQPLRSTYDVEHDTIRTTVKGQKVVLAKGDKELHPQVTAYTKLVDRVDLILVSCMAKSLVPARDVCFHEILIFDGKNLCRDLIAAAPRASVERALGRPHDYLACECCNFMEGQLAGTQPATALAYQLYLESGATINIQDFWLAFRAVLDPDGLEEGQLREEETLALFHRALAELRYLGMLKNNKRKADHLAKIRWKGL